MKLKLAESPPARPGPRVRSRARAVPRAAAPWLALVLAVGCRSGPGVDPDPAPSLVARAQELRALLERGDFAAARARMAPDPRRWWGERVGAGEPWSVGPGPRGPWAAWDEEFRSRHEVVAWHEGERAATALVRESNDYFRLLERGSVTNALTYSFDDGGRIEGLVIRPAGERPPGRADEFLAWACANEPAELAALMPGGEIDPSGDHPGRFRRLLERWRSAAGLGPIPSDVTAPASGDPAPPPPEEG